jgi:hypothetical protein
MSEPLQQRGSRLPEGISEAVLLGQLLAAIHDGENQHFPGYLCASMGRRRAQATMKIHHVPVEYHGVLFSL